MKPVILVIFILLAGCSSLTQQSTETLPPSSKSDDSLDLEGNDSNISENLDQSNNPSVTDDTVSNEPPEPVANIWQRLVKGFTLENPLPNQRIQKQLKRYDGRQDKIDLFALRAQPYLHHVLNEIYARGMPTELALLPIIESGYDPFAYSHGHAAGIWQFIESTGGAFGLEQNWWHDQRRDIRASTTAALDYLVELNSQFDGDWLLALAAYNAGAGNVRKAIRKNQRLGKPTNYWSLPLPRETQIYVPRLLALARVIQYPAAHKIALAPMPDQPFFKAISLDTQVDLGSIAEATQTPLKDLWLLNPQINHWVSPPTGPFQYLIPFNKESLLASKMPLIQEMHQGGWRQYQVKSGDTLRSIANQTQQSPTLLSTLNRLRDNQLRKGQILIVPKASVKPLTSLMAYQDELDLPPGRQQPQITIYTVKRGDSLWSIARSHDVTISALRRWNNISTEDVLKVGRKLTIHGGHRIKTAAKLKEMRYQVKTGDSLVGIAKRFDIKTGDLKRWNTSALESKYLQPGQELTVYVDAPH
ncbi:MAG: LysM peptidoglycan-binding domain-containing protein [Oleibacter sp.]|nr:LysM peptidoglycan-binding domain-containing protein [Thalassolituus sp.]